LRKQGFGIDPGLFQQQPKGCRFRPSKLLRCQAGRRARKPRTCGVSEATGTVGSEIILNAPVPTISCNSLIIR